jgi:hypothetical protein
MMDPSNLVHAIADGLTLAQAADRFGVSIDEVRAAQKEALEAFSNGEALRLEWMLESKRLAACGMRFYQIAMRDNDPQAATIFLKASERRATLTGANAPVGHSLSIMYKQAAEVQKTSTERIHDAFDAVLGISMRERQLLDQRELDGDKSPEVLAEINELRAQRGKLPMAADDHESAD